MKHVLFVLWFPIAVLIFSLFNALLSSLAASFGLGDYSASEILIFLVSAIIVGELTLLLYRRLYKN